jgi:aspartate aminotransferase-like enzyme
MQALLALNEQPVYHRSNEFKQLFEVVNKGLKYVFQTEEEVYTLATSGTGIMETALVNTLSEGDEIIVCGGGKFSERWFDLAICFNIKPHLINVLWGESVSIEGILFALSNNPNTKAICLTHSETSTGALNDIEEIILSLRKIFNGLIIIDAITSIGVHQFYFDKWGVDVAICSSQKGLMSPAGLSFICLSKRAKSFQIQSNISKYYLDLKKYEESLKINLSPFTPAVNLIYALNQSLKLIIDESLEKVWIRHKITADLFKSEMKKIGFEMFPNNSSNGVLTYFLPFDNFIEKLKIETGIVVSGGQDKLKGKVFRVGNMGLTSLLDIDNIVSSIKKILK